MEAEPARRPTGLFTPSPSFELLKKPQNLVTLMLNSACIVLALVATVCAAVTISNLDFPDLSGTGNSILDSVENTRTQTRVACAFIFLITMATIVLQVILILLTVLNFGFAQRYSIAVLIFEAIGGLACAAVFFAISVALAVYSGEWIEFRDLIRDLYAIIGSSSNAADEVIDAFNLNVLVPSTGATSAFGFLSTFALIGLVVWVVLATFIFKKSRKNSTQP